METHESSPEKRIVDQLNFGAKTAKRVGWEAWEFTVVGPHLLEVTNASYGFEKDDHTYQVGIEERGGVPVPAECGCPADKYNEEYDCKHKVALATCGGSTVLNAAVNYSSAAAASSSENTERLADKLKTDGGVSTDEAAETAVSEESNEDAPRYTYHRELPHVGGERYVRCEECGAECIPADPDRMLHREGCSEGER